MERIEIQGYKSIRQLNLELQPVNILIGANGSGKSNFLSFFDLLKNMYRQNLQEYVALRGGVDKFLFNGRKITGEISAKLWFRTSGYSFTLKTGEEAFVIRGEELWNKDHTIVPTYEASFLNESNFRYNMAEPTVDGVNNFLEELQRYHFHDTGEKSPFNNHSNIDNDCFFLYDKGQNIAAFLYDIQQNHQAVYLLIIKTIQSIAPYFLDFDLRPDSNGNVRLRWQSRHSSTIYGVNDLSDGTLRFMALSVLFLQPDLPKTIIIDEPELGLHPAAVAKLAGMIRSAAAKGSQVIAATQSADLISHFKPEDIISADQVGGETIFKRLNSEILAPWLEEFTIDDLWKRNIIDNGQPNNL